MYTFLSILYVFVCLFLILVVLLQSGKGGGLGSAFGGSSTQIFGGAGAGNLLTRLTAVSAFLYEIYAILLVLWPVIIMNGVFLILVVILIILKCRFDKA